MKSKIIAVLVSLGSTALAVADPIQQTHMEWLNTIALAAHQTNYSGTFVHQYGNRLEASNISHILDRGGERTKLIKQNGSECAVISNNSAGWCDPGGKVGQAEQAHDRKAFPVLLPEQLSTLGENYQIHTGETARIAGFDTKVLELRPRDSLRYAHKMWVHIDSGLLLKAAVLSDRQEVVEQYTFIRLKIDSSTEPTKALSSISQTTAQLKLPPVQKIAAVADESAWKVDGIPVGFKKIAELQRSMRGKKNVVTQMVFSDGLVGISIFIETRSSNPDSVLGLSSQGAIHIYSKLNGDYLITVVGEVPPSTVLQVANSVRNRGLTFKLTGISQ
ncbi:MAG: MucB/RseB C-terminal domain-containing protein [Candidatus Nitrotoga sp.]